MPAMRRNDRIGPGITIESSTASCDDSLLTEAGCAPKAAGFGFKIANAGIEWQIAKENRPVKQSSRGEANRIETTPFKPILDGLSRVVASGGLEALVPERTSLICKNDSFSVAIIDMEPIWLLASKGSLLDAKTIEFRTRPPLHDQYAREKPRRGLVNHHRKSPIVRQVFFRERS